MIFVVCLGCTVPPWRQSAAVADASANQATASATSASAPTGSVATKVGLEGTYYLRHPNAQLTALPANDDSPVVLRIADVLRDKNSYLYEIRFIGLRPGSHDLRDYLAGSAGGPHQIATPQLVEVHSVLPDDHDGAIEDYSAAGRFWAWPLRALLREGVVVWGLATAAYVIYRFVYRPRVFPAMLSSQPTLADQLLPLVEAGLAGTLTTTGQARLERLLLAHWQQKLRLTALPPDQALRQMRSHATAGKLLRELEAWLHTRPGTHQVDVPALLAPYQTAAAIELQDETPFPPTQEPVAA